MRAGLFDQSAVAVMIRWRWDEIFLLPGKDNAKKTKKQQKKQKPWKGSVENRTTFDQNHKELSLLPWPLLAAALGATNILEPAPFASFPSLPHCSRIEEAKMILGLFSAWASSSAFPLLALAE